MENKQTAGSTTVAVLGIDPPRDRENAHWYYKTIPKEMFSDAMRDVLSKYSNIPEDEIEPHIYAVRDKAWDIFPYGTMGKFTFLQLSIAQAAQYPEVLERIKSGDLFLDLGCNLGQELRKLVYDGAPSENLYGSDLEVGFFNLGYDLFKDQQTLKSQFCAADALADSSALDDLDGKISILHASSLFHLFSRERQVKLGLRCVRLLKRQKGSLIFGRQSGSVESGCLSYELLGDTDIFRHNEQSWREMWDEIAQSTGTKWKIEVFMYDENIGPMIPRPGRKRMRFAMWLQ